MIENWPVADALAFLAGKWDVERTVRDLSAQVTGRFAGTTDFVPAADGEGGLRHVESGAFTWRGVERPAERTLFFRPGDEPGTAVVHFADGRFFHGLDLRTGSHVADHPCAADLYRGTFTVTGRDRWWSEWNVRGPAKNLVIKTYYRRAADSSAPAAR
ncbi:MULTISPECIES: DUF6314 family protein [Streptomyces]|uniref:DUF6314 domain-containing protein n=1 Tax=Streptomyces xanthii TaxID=2768069 RepID=A0A7H1BEW6_9ACTN|nr:DUF6314 family protein [Streptomyces xanthii]QNS07271.1 hypothetical protein IAG42_29175 [Streptomyces xanthii]